MTTPPAAVLQISAGTGPVEVRRFVAGLTEPLSAILQHRGVPTLELTHHGPDDAPLSAGLVLDLVEDAALKGLLGTHLLVEASRGRRARKRWFAHVGLHHQRTLVPVALDLREVELTACRASGPGGQHVNTTDTAVRAVHRPTGLSVKAQGERSRSRNRKAALDRLAALLTEQQAAAGRAAQRRRWRVHHQLERGRPVLTWTRSHKGELVPTERIWGWTP